MPPVKKILKKPSLKEKEKENNHLKLESIDDINTALKDVEEFSEELCSNSTVKDFPKLRDLFAYLTEIRCGVDNMINKITDVLEQYRVQDEIKEKSVPEEQKNVKKTKKESVEKSDKESDKESEEESEEENVKVKNNHPESESEKSESEKSESEKSESENESEKEKIELKKKQNKKVPVSKPKVKKSKGGKKN
jgi:prolyl oligopeptidase PreP (S9A serine peptidase family)